MSPVALTYLSPDTLSTPGLLLSADPTVIANNSPSGTFIVPTSVLYETSSGSPSLGLTSSRLQPKSPQNYLPDNTDPTPSSPLGILLSTNKYTPLKRPKENSSHFLITPVDTLCYPLSLNVKILQVLQPVLHR